MSATQYNLAQQYKIILYTLITIAVFVLLAFVFELYHYPLWMKEGGIIESVSAFGYFVCVALMVLKGGAHYLKRFHYFALLMVLFCFRELDFDKRFTTMGILKSRFYSSDIVPLHEKLIGVFVVLLLLYIVVTIIRKHAKPFVLGVKAKAPVELGVFCMLAILFFSKTIDGAGRKLSSFGITIQAETSTYISALEEVLELGIPMLIIAALWVYFGSGQQTTE